MPEDLMNFVVRKREENYMDKFRNQNALMKKFGEEGIKVYVVLDENKSMGQMLQESGVDEGRFIEVLEFMDSEGMVKLESTVQETALLKPPVQPKPVSKKNEEPAQKKEGGEQEGKKVPVLPPEYVRSPIAQEPRGTAEPLITITQESATPPESKNAEDSREGIPPKQEPPPVPGIMRDEHTSTPLPGRQKEHVLQPKTETAPILPKGLGHIEIRPTDEIMEEEREEPVVTEAPKPEDLLSPLERIIYDKFGQGGVEVYNLIDGEKTAEEILKETGVSETKLVEILEFMDDEGIIKLEKPKTRGGAKKKEEPEKKGIPFEPILDDGRGIPGDLMKTEDREKNVPIRLPKRKHIGFVSRMNTNMKLTIKYRGKGQKLFTAIDGNKDTVALAKDLKLSLEDVDHILKTLEIRNAVEMDPLTDESLKERYGSDGLKIFERYGRDGILIYELIGKEKNIKDIILRSKVEPKRGADIILFIHKVLGLSLPLDENVLYLQLGIKGA
ncbi:MAG: hypothetical protein ABIG39_04545 [Candidatus Micrarchaeota archaeon]